MYLVLLSVVFFLHAASAQSNPAVASVAAPVVVLPAASVNTAAVVPKDDDPSCKVLEQLSPAGSKCLVSGCYAYTRIACNNASNADVSSALDYFVKNKPMVTTADVNTNPIHLRLIGGALNFSRDIFTVSSGGSVINMIDTLELTGTDIGANADSAFDGLVNMTKLSLDKVPIESLSPATFDGLPALSTLFLSNLPKLKKMNAGFADTLVNSSNFKCLRMDMANADTQLPCDCSAVTSVQNYRKSLNATARALQDKINALMYANCDINVACVSGAQKVNAKDVNISEVCKQVTDKPAAGAATDKAAAGTTAAPKSGGGNAAATFHGNVLILLASVLLVGLPVMVV
ncbi:uncharacterized protein LOC129589048 [Paramacrobiotus metropolitanus]|uniref:uncharacterized protein LOC129589048 n=1 Tax=Paramacrobiotus metropolitanus TaxID=2943436 RepID=UPI002445DCBF|nr:uncharacterized protein LOC129589048 [Paramacrobiotus metropolitanus]